MTDRDEIDVGELDSIDESLLDAARRPGETREETAARLIRERMNQTARIVVRIEPVMKH